jgi:hypothetical protein
MALCWQNWRATRKQEAGRRGFQRLGFFRLFGLSWIVERNDKGSARGLTRFETSDLLRQLGVILRGEAHEQIIENRDSLFTPQGLPQFAVGGRARTLAQGTESPGTAWRPHAHSPSPG